MITVFFPEEPLQFQVKTCASMFLVKKPMATKLRLDTHTFRSNSKQNQYI